MNEHDPALVDRVARALGDKRRLDDARTLLELLEADGLTVAAAPPTIEAGRFTLLGTTGEHQPVILTASGAAAAMLTPANELAFIMDLAGRRNRPPSGDHHGPPELVEARYLLTPPQAADLIVAIGRACHAAGPAAGAALEAALDNLTT